MLNCRPRHAEQRDARWRDTTRPPDGGTYEHLGEDILASIKEEPIGFEGMKIDRMFFEQFEDDVARTTPSSPRVEAGQWDRVIDYVNREVFDKPNEYYTLDKLRKAAAVDRRLTAARDPGKGLRPDPALQVEG